MTPKERANCLLHKIYMFSSDETIVGDYHFSQRIKVENAKECALIVVDEILLNYDGLYKPEYCKFDAIGKRKFIFDGEHNSHMTGYDMQEYWKQVKTEIEKL